MLSHHDRRRLEAIEQQLMSDDPHLAERFTRWAPSRWATLRVTLMIVLGAVGTLAGILLWSPSVFILFLTALLVGMAWMVRGTRHARD
jgi:hypothetical protein